MLKRQRTLVAAAIVGAIAASAPAFAVGTTQVGGVGFATVTARATNYSAYVSACGSGDASTLYVAGEWVVELSASRSDGSSVEQRLLLAGPHLNGCWSVPKNGALAGQVTIQVHYVGAGAQVYGAGAASVAWGPKLAIETP